MNICSCNVIRDCDIRAAAARGCRDAESAYAEMGCEFECGGCQHMAEHIVAESLAHPAERSQQAA